MDTITVLGFDLIHVSERVPLVMYRATASAAAMKLTQFLNILAPAPAELM